MKSSSDIIALRNAAPDFSLLVLGDLILDRYRWGTAARISPEAPVLVLTEDQYEVRLGGASSVAVLLRGLAANVTLAGALGADAEHHSGGRCLKSDMLLTLRARRKESTCPLDRWPAIDALPPAFRPNSGAEVRSVDPNTWITTGQLINDTAWLGGYLPGDIDAVIGIARSGLIPAQQIACMRHLPLLACRTACVALIVDCEKVGPAVALSIEEMLPAPACMRYYRCRLVSPVFKTIIQIPITQHPTAVAARRDIFRWRIIFGSLMSQRCRLCSRMTSSSELPIG